jgi:hypothetical protein
LLDGYDTFTIVGPQGARNICDALSPSTTSQSD